MAPPLSPKKKGTGAAHAIKRVFSNPKREDCAVDYDPDDEWGAAVRNHEDEGLVASTAPSLSSFSSTTRGSSWSGGGGLLDIRRVTSRVQSNNDGSAETVLREEKGSSAPTPPAVPLSRTTSSSSSSYGLTISPLPMSRTKSTPHGTSGIGYAMRRVFSSDNDREDQQQQSEWEEEAVELVHHDYVVSSSPARDVSSAEEEEGYFVSRVMSGVASMMQGFGGLSDETGDVHDVDIGDKQSKKTVPKAVSTNNNDSRDRSNNNNNKMAAEDHSDSSLFRDDANEAKLDSQGGYRLRRFLSSPIRGSRPKASDLRRTPSYEPDGYDEHGEPEYFNEPLGQLTPTKLGTPVGLTRTLSSRKKKKSRGVEAAKAKTVGNDNDDLSTVAESVDSSSLASNLGTRKKKAKSPFRRRMEIAFGIMALGLMGLALYFFVGDPFGGKGDGVHSANSNVYTADLEDSYGETSNDIEGEDDDETTSMEDEGQFGAESDDEVITWHEPDGGNGRPNNKGEANIDPLEEVEGQSGGEMDPLQAVDDVSGDDAGSLEEETEAQGEPDQPPNDTSPPMGRPTATKPLASLSILNSTSSPTNEPTNEPTPKPSYRPTDLPTEETYTKFYLIADCPYDDNERYNIMPKYLEDLTTEAEFMVHLGDFQYAKVDQCQEYAYESAKDILKKSPVPTFVIPGDNDLNDCDDHEHGEEMWMQYFHKFDERWDHSFDLHRWGSLDESFSFLHKRVLYFGVNIVGGSPYSSSEKKSRHAQHLRKIRSILDELDSDDFDVMVLFGHAEPSDHHEDFFGGSDGFAAIVEDVGKPTVHFHGDYHSYYEVEGDFDVDNYLRISLDGESIAPPIRVEIDTSKSNPIKVSRRRSDLDVDCCESGWPRDRREL